MCYPVIYTNLRVLGAFGYNADWKGNPPGTVPECQYCIACDQKWEIQVPQDQGFESWFSANIETLNNYIKTFNGAVGM